MEIKDFTVNVGAKEEGRPQLHTRARLIYRLADKKNSQYEQFTDILQ